MGILQVEGMIVVVVAARPYPEIFICFLREFDKYHSGSRHDY